MFWGGVAAADGSKVHCQRVSRLYRLALQGVWRPARWTLSYNMAFNKVTPPHTINHCTTETLRDDQFHSFNFTQEHFDNTKENQTFYHVFEMQGWFSITVGAEFSAHILQFLTIFLSTYLVKRLKGLWCSRGWCFRNILCKGMGCVIFLHTLTALPSDPNMQKMHKPWHCFIIRRGGITSFELYECNVVHLMPSVNENKCIFCMSCHKASGLDGYYLRWPCVTLRPCY